MMSLGGGFWKLPFHPSPLFFPCFPFTLFVSDQYFPVALFY